MLPAQYDDDDDDECVLLCVSVYHGNYCISGKFT